MQVRKVVRIPTGSCGLSEPIAMRGYRPAAIKVPGDWAAANLTFRGAAAPPAHVTQVVPTGTVAGLAPDANPQDIQMTNAVTLHRHGAIYTPAKVDPIDISTLLSAAATIGTSKYGALWVFQKITGSTETGVIAVETDKDTADHTSLIMALSKFSVSARAMPDRSLYVPIGIVHVLEGGSGPFTWGADSIAAETETYYDLCGLPEVLVPGTIALDAGAATFTYGAATLRLGTGLKVAATGKANVTIAGSNIADGAVGAWLIYVMADDVEIAVQLGAAYPDLASAKGAVADHRPNPMLPLIAAMYVVNASGGAFTPGTSKLDDTGFTTTFESFGPRFANVYQSDGTELSVTAAANRHIILSGEVKEYLTGLGALQVRSGTSGTPVSQTTNAELELVLESV